MKCSRTVNTRAAWLVAGNIRVYFFCVPDSAHYFPKRKGCVSNGKYSPFGRNDISKLVRKGSHEGTQVIFSLESSCTSPFISAFCYISSTVLCSKV